MPINDPSTWAQAAGAIKATVDSARSVWSLIKDYRSAKGDESKQKQLEKQIDSALATASSSAEIAEVEIKKALGYRLCYCEYPPNAMLTVGYARVNSGTQLIGDQVYECPKCGLNTAGPYDFTRTVPKKAQPRASP